MITIRTYQNPVEASLAQTLLADSGIEAVLANPGDQLPLSGCRLEVAEEDAARALKMLDTETVALEGAVAETAEGSADADGEEGGTPSEHEVESRPAAEDSLPNVVCPGCGTEWKLTEEEGARPTFVCGECGASIALGERKAAGQSEARKLGWRSLLPRSEGRFPFVLAMFAYAYVLGRFVSDIVGPLAGTDDYLKRIIGWEPVLRHVASSVILTPIWETLLLVAIIEVVRLVRAPGWLQVVVSTVSLCAVDGHNFWPHGVNVFPFFVICGVSYLYWRNLSWVKAIGMVIVLHAMSNTLGSTWLICTQVDRDRQSLEKTGYAADWGRADHLYQEGAAYLKEGSTPEALEVLQQAVSIYPYDARYHVVLGRALRKSGRLSAGEAEVRKAIDLDGYDWAAWEGLAVVLNDEKRYPQALNACQRALEIAPPYSRADVQSWMNEIEAQLTGTGGR